MWLLLPLEVAECTSTSYVTLAPQLFPTSCDVSMTLRDAYQGVIQVVVVPQSDRNLRW